MPLVLGHCYLATHSPSFLVYPKTVDYLILHLWIQKQGRGGNVNNQLNQNSLNQYASYAYESSLCPTVM
jgi:hypothetical protein